MTLQELMSAVPAGDGEMSVGVVVDVESGAPAVAIIVGSGATRLMLALTPEQAYQIAESIRAEAALAEAVTRRKLT